MTQDPHRLIETDRAEDIDDRQVLLRQAIVRIAAEAAAGHIVRLHQKNARKLNRLQATWIKFDR